jgi:hypothetical protein
MTIKYCVVFKNPNGSDTTHSKHETEHDALESLYQIVRFRKNARIEYPDFESRKHDYYSLSKFGLELVWGLFCRMYSTGSSTFENEKALDSLSGLIMELAEIHKDVLDKAEHEIDMLIRK